MSVLLAPLIAGAMGWALLGGLARAALRRCLSRPMRLLVFGWLIVSGIVGSIDLWSFAGDPVQPGLTAYVWAVAFLFVIFVATAAIWPVALLIQAVYILGRRS
jgi:hypothetical protein